ncbi:MAG: helix-turn-helix domain-containing protein [Patescibacteria group bacterium]
MAKQTQKNRVMETLEKLGLGENEAVLYTLMIKHPKSTVQELQTRSPFPRTMLYYVLRQLEQRGLVTSVKEEWRTVYIAENPERLYDILATREREFAEESQSVRELIPELKNKYRLAGNRPDMRIFEGIEEYKKALEDIIISKPDVVRAYSDLSGKKKPGLEVRESHEHKRIGKKIIKKVLFVGTDMARGEIKRRSYDNYTQFRAAQEQLSGLGVDFQLYNGKILYTTYDDREPIALLVEDKTLYAMQCGLFDMLWAKAQDVTLLSTSKRN